MANPLHDLQDRLQKLQQEKGRALNEVQQYKARLEDLDKDILKFEKSIALLKKGE